MLAILWFSGGKETAEALQNGKRFVLHVEGEKIEGRDVGALTTTANPEKSAEHAEHKDAEAEVPIIPKAVEPPKEDLTVIPAVQKSQAPIADILPDLAEKKDDLNLPHPSADGRKIASYYAKAFKRPDERPIISIIVTGLGHSRQVTQSALALNENIGLSFSPYSRTIAGWVEASRVSGHEAYIDLPMQTSGYPAEDPGPYALLLSRSNTQNIAYLHWAMSRTQGYVGLFTPVDGVMSTNSEAYKPLVTDMARRGAMLFMGNEPLLRETKDVIDQSKVDKLVGDVWIDEELSEMGMQARFATLEQTAQRNGFAIGVVHAYPISIAQLKHWLEREGVNDFILAPPSFINQLKR